MWRTRCQFGTSILGQPNPCVIRPNSAHGDPSLFYRSCDKRVCNGKWKSSEVSALPERRRRWQFLAIDVEVFLTFSVSRRRASQSSSHPKFDPARIRRAQPFGATSGRVPGAKPASSSCLPMPNGNHFASLAVGPSVSRVLLLALRLYSPLLLFVATNFATSESSRCTGST